MSAVKRREYYHKNKSAMAERRKLRLDRRLRLLCRDCPSSVPPGKVFCSRCNQGNVFRKQKSLDRIKMLNYSQLDLSIYLRTLLTE